MADARPDDDRASLADHLLVPPDVEKEFAARRLEAVDHRADATPAVLFIEASGSLVADR